jgi:hypothetical protein
LCLVIFPLVPKGHWTGPFPLPSLFHVLPPFQARLWYAPLSCWLPCPRPMLTSFPTGLAKVLPWLIGSFSQTDSSCAAYSSPWWWRQQVPLRRR